jgi:hypothetical protein
MRSHVSRETYGKGNECALFSKAIGAAGSSLAYYFTHSGQETHSHEIAGFRMNCTDTPTCGYPMGDMSSGFLRNTLFFGLIWYCVLFGSERVLQLTVKNLLIAPGGPG